MKQETMKISKQTHSVDIHSLSVDELEEHGDTLLSEIASIKFQLERAKSAAAANNDYSDRAWFLSARHALRMKGIEHQRVMKRCAQLKKERNAAQVASVERAFIELSKTVIDKKTFLELMAQARMIAGIPDKKAS